MILCRLDCFFFLFVLVEHDVYRSAQLLTPSNQLTSRSAYPLLLFSPLHFNMNQLYHRLDVGGSCPNKLTVCPFSLLPSQGNVSLSDLKICTPRSLLLRNGSCVPKRRRSALPLGQLTCSL